MAVRKTTSPARGRRKAVEHVDVSRAGDRAALDGVAADRISRRAYELFLARGGEHGRDMDDWLQAEREVSVEKSETPLSSSVTALGVEDPARGTLRRKQYEQGAGLVSEID